MSDDLERLEDVKPSILSKLRAVGFTSIETLAVTPAKELVARAHIEEDVAYKICDQARRLMNYGFLRAAELWEKRKNLQRCTTGSAKLDKILGGGG